MSKRPSSPAAHSAKRAKSEADPGPAPAVPARVCAAAPDFTADAVLPDQTLGKVTLSDGWKAGEWTVLASFPLAFTFVCQTELVSLSNAAETFKGLNTRVVLWSVDSAYASLAWTNTPRKEGGIGKLNVPIVSDLTHKISRDYGALLEDAGHTSRRTVIIDDKGVVRHVSDNDPPVGRSVDELVRLVQAYQSFEKNGEVCPAAWRPGGATIKPDPVGKLEYFEKHG